MPPSVLREMRVEDVPSVMDVQEPMSIAGLSAVFPRLRVYAANPRGRAFWEKCGWTDTGERGRGPMPPHAEQMVYAYTRESSGSVSTVAP